MKSTIAQSAKSLSLVVLLIIGAMFTACSDKELVTDPRQDANAAQTYTMVVNATKGDDASTRALSLEGKTLSATWAEGERVTVYNVTKGADLEGYLEAQSSGASTTLKGTLTGTIENGDNLTLKFLSPTYGTQDGTLTGNPTSIDKVCDYAEATVEVTNASTASVTTTDADFENQQAIVKFTLKDKADVTTAVRITSLTVNADGSTYTVTPAYVTDVLFVAIPAISGKTVTLTATDGISKFTYEKSGVTFENSQYYEIGVKMTNTTDYLTVPLTFEAKSANAQVSFNKGANVTLDNPIEYSINGGAWNEYTSTITLSHIGDKVSFRSTNTRYATSSDSNFWSNFSCNKDCYLYGNIMSLISKDGFASATSLTGNYAFCKMFYNNTHIDSHASKTLKLPATTLTDHCYHYLFYNCTCLTSAPALPATTLTPYCYYGMFLDCTNLINAPELPATNLAYYCYEDMFYECASLTTAPALPATSLATGCYESMFVRCTNLTTAPALPATSLATYCYANMFSGCTSLTTAPALPATTLQPECYQQMFYGCTSLTTAPILPATELKTQCYYCMFYECSNLNNVTCFATDISASNCTGYWLYKVAASGTFTKNSAMSSWTSGDRGIPSGWTTISVVPGAFSVSSTKQVYFSNGNLRYTSGAWSFFDNQWDYYTTYSADSWDKFGWSTFATTYGMNTSTSNSTYSGDFKDWGNAIGSGWSTLSHTEWEYIFKNRASGSTVNGTSDARYTHATINTDVNSGVNGMILFPDGVTVANGEATSWGTINGNSSWGTKCTSAQWTALAAKGCVFLPAAGDRDGSSSYNVGSYGQYWSDTPDGSDYAMRMNFYSGGLNTGNIYSRYHGYSVRLVRDAN